jgi:hypothetical protein
MRKRYDPSVLTGLKGDYLYCDKKKNKPRVHHLICENNCKKVKKCLSYSRWLEANKVEEEKKVKEKPKKKPLTKRKKPTTKKKPKKGGKK